MISRGHDAAAAVPPGRRRRSAAAAAAGLALLAGAAAARAAGTPDRPATPDSPTGRYANGALLMNGRLVTPAGRTVPLGDFPEGIAVAPDGSLAVIANGGQGEGSTDQGNQSLQVVDLERDVVVQTITDHLPRTDVFYNAGLAFSADGHHLFAAGGGNDQVYDYAVGGGRLGLAHTWRTTLKEGAPIVGFPNGLDAGIPTSAPEVGDVAGYSRGLALTPDGATLMVANEQGDSVAALDTASGGVRWETQLGGVASGTGLYPGDVVVSGDGATVYVAEQGGNALAVLDATHGTPRGLVPVGDHPTAVRLTQDSHYAYVTNANDDSLSIVDVAASPPAEVRRLSTHLFTGEADGSSPNAVAIDDQRQLIYVTNAGDDAVAVFGTGLPTAGGAIPPGSQVEAAQGSPQAAVGGLPNTAAIAAPDPARVHLLGFLPTGFYPSAVAVRPGDGAVLAVSAKGYGGIPVDRATEYDGNDMVGLLDHIATPAAADLSAGTAQARADVAFATSANGRRPADSPIPDAAHAGQSPIKHVVVIVRENRTFDQVFGDLGSLGRSDADINPAYVEFPRTDARGRTITVNAHKIAATYGLSDNFYSDGEASIQGHHWTAEGTSSDYTEKSWLDYYSSRNHTYDPTAPIVYPRCGAVFQQLAAAGKTFRDFGELVGLSTTQTPTTAAAPDVGCATPGGTQDGVVAANTDLAYPNNLTLTSIKDTDRFTEFKRVYDPLVATDTVPQFSYVLMGNDHTDGTAAGKPTPQALVATNDLAVGRLVDYLSHTPQWSSTAVFIEEDDSQDGLDHRDGHRNILLVASPYAVPGRISHVHTSQASVMRLTELILGLRPLTTYSQNAPVPYDLFQSTPTPAPYTAETPTYDMTAVNPASSSGASAAHVDISAVDRGGPMLEAQIWEATRPGEALPAALVPGGHGRR